MSVSIKEKSCVQSSSTPLPTAEDVSRYLRTHPDFFVDRDHLLLDLAIPHNRGDAVSLVERQLHVLRSHNLELRSRLGKLVDVARNNDRLFENMRKLVLTLLESSQIEQVASALKDSLDHDFDVDFHSLILFQPELGNTDIRVESAELIDELLDDVWEGKHAGMTADRIYIGRIKKSQQAFLFPDCSDDIGSVVLAPLNFPEQLGLLVLASRDGNCFRASMGAIFVRYLGDVISRVLSRLVR